MKSKGKNVVYLDNRVTSSRSIPFAYASPACLENNSTLTSGISDDPYQLLTNEGYIKALNEMSLTRKVMQ